MLLVSFRSACARHRGPSGPVGVEHSVGLPWRSRPLAQLLGVSTAQGFDAREAGNSNTRLEDVHVAVTASGSVRSPDRDVRAIGRV